MTSNTHYYIPAGSPFPWKFGTSHYFLPISHLTFPSSYCVQNLIFFAFWGIGKSEKCPIKSTGTIDHLQCIVYRMWFYFTNNFKTFETSPKRKLLSHYQSNYVKWLVHIYSGTYLFQYSLYKTHCCEYLWYFWLPVAEQKSSS